MILNYFGFLSRLYFNKKISANLNIHLFNLSVTSLLYAALAWLSLLYAESIHLLFVGMVIAYIAAGSVITVVSIFQFFAIYVVIQMVGLITAFLYHGQEIFYISAVLATIFTVFVISNGYRQYLSIKEMIKLHNQINDLLNNVGQGFLSFDKNLKCESSFSLECKKIFNKENIEGLDISELLFSQNNEDKELFCEGIYKTIDCDDKMIKEMLLSLIPKKQTINNRPIKIECKALENDKFMLVLTDITKTSDLKSKIKLQTLIQNMIIAVASDKNDFIELKNNFERFITELQNKEDSSLETINNIRRQMHTFKGNFAQKGMRNISNYIHEVELQVKGMSFNDEIMSTILKANFKEEINKDLSTISSALGEEFLNSVKTANVNINAIDDIESEIKSLLPNLKSNSQKSLNTIFKKVKELKHKSIKQMLTPYISHVKNLSEKTGKDIYELEIQGDENIKVKPEIEPFIKSLVHVFNNCVDHGIEDADTRVDLDKDEVGKITCSFEVISDVLILKISDDGKGIDTQKLSEKAIANSIKSQEELELMSEEEKCKLIFANNLSTKEEVSIVSGMGIGMSSVKTHLENLYARYSIENNPGDGVTFTFYIPINLNLGSHLTGLEKCENICTSITEQTIFYLQVTIDVEIINTQVTEEAIIEKNYAQIDFHGKFNSTVIMIFPDDTVDLLSSTLIPDGFSKEDMKWLVQELPNEVLNTIVGLSIQHFDKNLQDIEMSPPMHLDNLQLMKAIRSSKDKYMQEIETSFGKIMCIVLKREE